MALLTYRATPLQNGFSLAALSMGRCLRATVSIISSKLIPSLLAMEILKRKEKEYRENQKRSYDVHHKVHHLSQLYPGDNVWVTDLRIYGKVTKLGNTPRSYFIQINNGVICRNRYYLIPFGINDGKQIEPEKDLTTPVQVTSANLI